MSKVALFVLACLVLGCGKNEVTIKINGGDGRQVRLDANSLEFKFNRLVDAGTFNFPGIKSGTYTVGVVAGTYLDMRDVVVEAPPLSGVENYEVVFDIPAGSNSGSKAEGTIVFSSKPSSGRERNWDLFTVKADGSQLQQLTDTPENEQHPSWSPDGKKIAFTQGEVMTNFDIYVINEDGSGRVRLTEHAERDQEPAWSPDGSKIAFVSTRDGDKAIWVMDADGGNKKKVIVGRAPAWSPDGKKLAFVSDQFDGSDEVYLVDVDGSNRQRMTDNIKKFDWFPAWSADGSQLVFNSERFGGQELIAMKADGSDQMRLTVAEKTYEIDPVWSPDGKAVAYSGKIDTAAVRMWEMDGEDYDIFIVETTGFNVDDMTKASGMPINLTKSPDREDKSPSWRAF